MYAYIMVLATWFTDTSYEDYEMKVVCVCESLKQIEQNVPYIISDIFPHSLIANTYKWIFKEVYISTN